MCSEYLDPETFNRLVDSDVLLREEPDEEEDDEEDEGAADNEE